MSASAELGAGPVNHLLRISVTVEFANTANQINQYRLINFSARSVRLFFTTPPIRFTAMVAAS